MFRASSCPSSGATTTAVAAYGLPSELGGSSVVGRGRADRLFISEVKEILIAHACLKSHTDTHRHTVDLCFLYAVLILRVFVRIYFKFKENFTSS
jgi:hypothetical protein